MDRSTAGVVADDAGGRMTSLGLAWKESHECDRGDEQCGE